MERITLGDKTFEKFISADRIDRAVAALAVRIDEDYKDKNPLLIGVLNGAFVFMADLVRGIGVECGISFVKLSSYCGTESGGEVSELIGLRDGIAGRHIIVVEDIVETGCSIEHLWRAVGSRGAASVEVAALLLKPGRYTKDIPVKYAAMEIPDDFIVGYGLDYNGAGRNLRDIYKVVDER